MNQHVWILIREEAFETDEILRVCASEADAEARLAYLNAHATELQVGIFDSEDTERWWAAEYGPRLRPGDSYRVEKWEVKL